MCVYIHPYVRTYCNPSQVSFSPDVDGLLPFGAVSPFTQQSDAVNKGLKEVSEFLTSQLADYLDWQSSIPSRASLMTDSQVIW